MRIPTRDPLGKKERAGPDNALGQSTGGELNLHNHPEAKGAGYPNTPPRGDEVAPAGTSSQIMPLATRSTASSTDPDTSRIERRVPMFKHSARH